MHGQYLGTALSGLGLEVPSQHERETLFSCKKTISWETQSENLESASHATTRKGTREHDLIKKVSVSIVLSGPARAGPADAIITKLIFS